MAAKKKKTSDRKLKVKVVENGPHKVDARLAALLRLNNRKLRQLKNEDVRAAREYRLRLEKLRSCGPEQIESKEGKAAAIANPDAMDGSIVPFTFGLYFPEDSPKEVRALTDLRQAFISATIRADVTATDLQNRGVHVRNQAGSIFTAFIPLDLVTDLIRNEAIQYIELARPYQSDLGEAIPYAQIDALHNANPAITGSGTVVGIFDRVLDIYHVDFRLNDGAGGDGQGSSRVEFLWDQELEVTGAETSPPVSPALPEFNPVGGSSYGVEYSNANINAELQNFQPGANPGAPPITPPYQLVRHGGSESSHGTHVAGCATGNGRGAPTGAAPGSTLIFVNRRSDFNYILSDSTFVLDAFAYIFARATAMGKPCVVNMSNSDNMGPHDGTTNGETFLDNLLLTPGRAIVLSAGNTNTSNSHTAGTVSPGGSTVVTLTYFADDNDGDGVVDEPSKNDQIELWYDGHDRFSVTLTMPTATPNTLGPVAPGTTATATLVTGHTVEVAHSLNDSRNGDNVITVFIRDVSAANPIPAGNWTFELTGASVINGNFTAWVDRNNRFSADWKPLRAWATPISDELTIATPATSLRSIAVGSHSAGQPLPTITNFSSAGPTRDGRVKPDITANGEAVVAARSRDMRLGVPGDLSLSLWGTSHSAPIVAGACALLFECRGAGLSWSDLKQIIWNTAGIPAVGTPDTNFGFGFLQMGAACTAADPDIDVWARDHVSDTGVEPFTGPFAYQSPDIEVLDMGGTPVPNPTHDPTNFVNNIIRVTVRNRGTQIARNVRVFLYWADPATNIPYPAAWQTTGIYTGDPNWVVESNVIVVPTLAAGAAQQVRFAWAPPVPGSSIRGDDHFCLIARIETENDPSNVNIGGWPVIRGSNNIVLRNTHVQLVSDKGDSYTAFYFVGSDNPDRLEFRWSDLSGIFELTMPVAALPWRDISLGSVIPGRSEGYGSVFTNTAGQFGKERRAEGLRVTELTGIEGAAEIALDGTVASIRGTRDQPLILPEVRIKSGVKLPVRLKVSKVGFHKRETGTVHVRQLSGGKPIGGIALELHSKLPEPQRFKTSRVNGKLLIESLEA